MRAGRVPRNEQREGKVSVTSKLPHSLWQALRDEALEAGLDMSDIVREALGARLAERVQRNGRSDALRRDTQLIG